MDNTNLERVAMRDAAVYHHTQERDPVCRHSRLRAFVLLITGECRARVGLEQIFAVLH